MGVFTAGKPDRVECEFYAKLIAVVLFNRLLGAVPKAARQPLSPAKAWNRLREQVPDWVRQLGTGRGLEVLEKLVGASLKRATVSPKRTHPSTRDLVQQVAVTAFTKEFNVHRLWELHQVMKLSLLRTLANKHRTSLRKMIHKYQTVVSTPHGTMKALEVLQPRNEDRKPLVAVDPKNK